jgi:hypothetical protein
MQAWLRVQRQIESTVPCMPWRVSSPLQVVHGRHWNLAQLDRIRGPKVCPGYKRLRLVHCLCSYPCPNCPRCPPPFRVAAFLPFFLNLHPAPASCRFAFSLPLLSYLPSSLTDLWLHQGHKAFLESHGQHSSESIALVGTPTSKCALSICG